MAFVAGLGVCLGCVEAPSPREVFEARVVPVLERACAAPACHGVAPDAEERGETIDWSLLFFRLDARGRIADLDRAYEAARRAITTVEEPAFSTLLRKPLSVRRGGLGHFGGESFVSTNDPSYQAIHAWIAMEDVGGEDPEPLTELEQRFADTVQPLLVEATCMTSRCHGAAAGGIPYRLDEGYLGRFSTEATRHNYTETLAMVTLDGYPSLSRLVRKAQPLGLGIVHKGLNFDFFEGDAGGGLAAIEDWICAERRARTGHGCADPEELPMSGFVFVRGSIPAGHAFDLTRFEPGSDILLATVDDASLVPTSFENLTAALHPSGPADVRDPAVSRDGRQLLFAMRTAADEGHHLWLLDLITREARPLTSGNRRLLGGGLATDRDPTWGPDGSVWFASTRAGVLADGGAMLDAEIYSLDPSTGALRRWTYTPHVERKPVFFDLGDEAGGEVAFDVLRDAIPAQARAHVFRFPPSLRTEYHQHFGITPTATFVHDLRELPDGRYVGVVGDLPAPWEAGSLAVIERNFGPEINASSAAQAPALERYDAPLVLVAEDGAYRDPAPLRDGRVLVAHAPSPFDPSDGSRAPTPRLELLELGEALDGRGPFVRRTTVLVDEGGVALTDPEPIAPREPVRAESPRPVGDDETAIVRHQGLPMIDALLANLSPSGPKVPLEGIAYVRLVEHLPLRPDERAPLALDDAPEGATTAALGRHGPARILAELPVAADGTFQARVPVNTPFRLQALDASRMAIGVMHNRWYYTLPGQVLTQGISVATGTSAYDSRCNTCHGDPGGTTQRPEIESLDAVTGASLSLSRFENQNPRLPIDPPTLSASTRLAIDFVDDVQPILDRRCATCHAGPSPAASLDLSGAPTTLFTRAYESLLAPGTRSGSSREHVDDGDGRARSSHLVERLVGTEMDAPGVLPVPGEPHPEPGTAAPLREDELLTLVRWIELGATFRGRDGAR